MRCWTGKNTISIIGLWLDFDIIEILDEFRIYAETNNITIKLYSERGVVENPESYVEFFKKKRFSEMNPT